MSTLPMMSRALVAGLFVAIAAPALGDMPIPHSASEITTSTTAALARADAAVAAIVAVPDNQRTFANTIGALDDLFVQLEVDSNANLFMPFVSTDPAMREAGDEATAEVESWMIDLSQREDLYEAVQAYADSKPALAGEQARLLKFTMRDYRRSGMNLSASDRARLADVQKELSRLSIEFESAIRNDETVVPLTREELVGMSDEFIDGLENVDGVYLLTMAYTQFNPLLDQCSNETTRKKVWIEYKRRGGRANVDVLEKILLLRAEQAALLGYDHPADYETEVRMSKNAARVQEFYDTLRPLVRRKAEQDWAEFLAAKRADTGDPNANFYPWDFSYYQKKLMRDRYAVDAEAVRAYLPMNRVIDGLFGITQKLYGIEYREVTDRTAGRNGLWHDSVRHYEVYDTDTSDMLGEFYVDLHPRDNKYGHAAQWGIRPRKLLADGTVQTPIAVLVCNFTAPTKTAPALMSHDEVETFFHEFGHCLHTILTTADYARFAGTSVERDFVEAPSQMFENWIWDADVLNTFAGHYETGEPLPAKTLEGMIAARNLGSGMLAEHQFYYGLTDMTYHLDPDGKMDTTKIGLELFPEVELYDMVPGTHFQSAFGHLTGYQAGYYGYQWSLVFASDMFQRFKELGMLDPDAGRYYRDHILAPGGTMDGMDLVTGYLGREPDLGAYLKHLGLEEDGDS